MKQEETLIRTLDPFGNQERSQSAHDLGIEAHIGDISRAKVSCPALIDLVTFPQEPGSEHRETLHTLALSAKNSGVGLVGLMPDVNPVADHDGVVRTLRDGAQSNTTGVQFLPHGALSVGLKHVDIAPMGELREAGVRMISDGGKPIRAPRFLRRALEYALNFDLPVLLQPLDPDLAEGGLAPEGPEATRYGLPSIPEAAERLAVLRAGELARLTGAHVILFPIVTEAGLDALDLIQRRGARVSGGTALPYLCWSVNDLSSFDGIFRVHPPLWREPDVKAICDGVGNGTLKFLSTGHRAINFSEKATELAAAEPGMASLPNLWDLLLHIEKKRGVSLLDLVKGFTTGPAELLGIEPWTSKIVIGNGRIPEVAEKDYAPAKNFPDLGRDALGHKLIHVFGREGPSLINYPAL